MEFLSCYSVRGMNTFVGDHGTRVSAKSQFKTQSVILDLQLALKRLFELSMFLNRTHNRIYGAILENQGWLLLISRECAIMAGLYDHEC